MKLKSIILGAGLLVCTGCANFETPEYYQLITEMRMEAREDLASAAQDNKKMAELLTNYYMDRATQRINRNYEQEKARIMSSGMDPSELTQEAMKLGAARVAVLEVVEEAAREYYKNYIIPSQKIDRAGRKYERVVDLMLYKDRAEQEVAQQTAQQVTEEVLPRLREIIIQKFQDDEVLREAEDTGEDLIENIEQPEVRNDPDGSLFR